MLQVPFSTPQKTIFIKLSRSEIEVILKIAIVSGDMPEALFWKKQLNHLNELEYGRIIGGTYETI